MHQAHGLSFSVLPGNDIPPSLKNIYQELHDDLGCYIPNNGYLKKWADQGVLLLNTVLTVRAHQANSHQGKGWEQFTDAVIEAVNAQDRPIVIFLWGAPAGRKAKMLTNPKHLVLKAPHPSPLSAYRGFFGCKHFSKAKGSQPKSKFIRGLAWVACRWAGLVRPRVIMLENVEEFKTWGPLNRRHHPIKSKQGETFKKFVAQLEDLGYVVEFRELVAADYGAPTMRKRLFMIARCDGRPIIWPAPTHGPIGNEKVKAGLLKPYVGAYTQLDFSLPVLVFLILRKRSRKSMASVPCVHCHQKP